MFCNEYFGCCSFVSTPGETRMQCGKSRSDLGCVVDDCAQDIRMATSRVGLSQFGDGEHLHPEEEDVYIISVYTDEFSA